MEQSTYRRRASSQDRASSQTSAGDGNWATGRVEDFPEALARAVGEAKPMLVIPVPEESDAQRELDLLWEQVGNLDDERLQAGLERCEVCRTPIPELALALAGVEIAQLEGAAALLVEAGERGIQCAIIKLEESDVSGAALSPKPSKLEAELRLRERVTQLTRRLGDLLFPSADDSRG